LQRDQKKRPIYIKRDLEKRLRKNQDNSRETVHQKREMYIRKDACTHQKRCMYIKRDIVTSKEVYTLCIKRDVCTSKEAQSRDPNKETLKKDLHRLSLTDQVEIDDSTERFQQREFNRESSTERVTSKEVYTHQKRCIYIKRDVNSTERALSLLSRRFPPDFSLSLFLSVSVSLSLC